MSGEKLAQATVESKENPKNGGDEKVLDTIEDLRSEVRELRNMVNMLVEMIVSLDTPDDMDGDLESNMMSYDPILKNGKYCM
jgi:hypothetical protein